METEVLFANVSSSFKGHFDKHCTSMLLCWYWLHFYMRRSVYRSTGLRGLKEETHYLKWFHIVTFRCIIRYVIAC